MLSHAGLSVRHSKSNLFIYLSHPELVCNCSFIFFHRCCLHFLISSSLHLFCPLACFLSGRPGSPWRCGWPRCLGRRRAGSPRHSEGTLGLASHHSHLPPAHIRSSFRFCVIQHTPMTIFILYESFSVCPGYSNIFSMSTF